MRKLSLTVLSLSAFVVAVLLSAPQTFAEERNLGKHSQNEIRDACNKAGGDLLGVSDSGSYGCEVPDKGTMILCNKNNECTGYTPARTQSQRKRILDTLKLTDKAAVATTGTAKPKKPAAAPSAAAKPKDQ